jgi:hypothetical protein
VRISFDIDDTLICDSSVPNEQHVSWWRRWRYPERLRRGTRSLMTALIRRRCKIWIYTSSGRCPRHLKSWFASFGIPIEGVVNLDRHERTVGLRGPSKFPPAFGIDLHVDDSPGVAMEGTDHRFAVLVVAPEDPDWVERVLCEVDVRIRSNNQWSAKGLAPYQPAIVNIILQYCPDIPHPLRNCLIFQNYFFNDQFLCKN